MEMLFENKQSSVHGQSILMRLHPPKNILSQTFS